MTDPFNGAPTNDEFDPDRDWPDTKDKKDTVIASEKNEGKMTITLKGGSGFESPWIVLYADDAADGLNQMQDENLKTLMEVVKRAGKHFAGGDSKAAQQPSNDKPARQQPPQDLSDDDRFCAHGERTFKTGTSKSGRAWKAMMCPTPQGTPDQCPPKWLR